MNEEIKKEDLQVWVKAKPEILPRPTYMPFLLALSFVLMAWGLLATWILSVTGLIGLMISLHGWIKEMLHDPAE
ncbi:MAG: hypothetical protein ACJ75B_18640 [Flavisolibacter sp.]